MTNSKHPPSQRPVPMGSFMLRRVYRQGETFCCGICRSGYSSAEDANGCLEGCWQRVLQRAPWSEIRKFLHKSVVCIYCHRSYETPDDATACAQECISRLTISSFDGTALAPPEQKRRFLKATRPIGNFRFKIGSSRATHVSAMPPEETKIPPPSSPIPPTSSMDALSEAKTIEAENAKKGASASEDRSLEYKKKFDRAGAKYVCVICQKKYFERLEVEKCFDSHSGQNQV